MIEDRWWQRPLATDSRGWPLETRDVVGVVVGWQIVEVGRGGESGSSVDKFWVRI